ncbi:unnamed protein product [Lampetra planeri]
MPSADFAVSSARAVLEARPTLPARDSPRVVSAAATYRCSSSSPRVVSADAAYRCGRETRASVPLHSGSFADASGSWSAPWHVSRHLRRDLSRQTIT